MEEIKYTKRNKKRLEDLFTESIEKAYESITEEYSNNYVNDLKTEVINFFEEELIKPTKIKSNDLEYESELKPCILEADIKSEPAYVVDSDEEDEETKELEEDLIASLKRVTGDLPYMQEALTLLVHKLNGAKPTIDNLISAQMYVLKKVSKDKDLPEDIFLPMIKRVFEDKEYQTRILKMYDVLASLNDNSFWLEDAARGYA